MHCLISITHSEVQGVSKYEDMDIHEGQADTPGPSEYQPGPLKIQRAWVPRRDQALTPVMQFINILFLLHCRVVAKEATFELRLHLIYLINDVLHHWYVRNAVINKQI